MITISGTMRTAHSSITARLSRHFRLVERRSSVRTEVVGGITTFVVMAYIILNP
jgi:xanthine/uracil/vitamin C permease (AzgA family)